MNFRKLIFVGLSFLLWAMAWTFFYPRTYNVLPFVERDGVEYWELSTGSTIGFTKIESKSSEKKSPIIYLHGGPGGMIHDEIIVALGPLSKLGHDVYFYDQIGSGHSARLTNIVEYTVQRHKADLEAIIEIIGAEKIILIGHSWGCLLAINYLQGHAGRVERMILEGPGPILPINWALIGQVPPDSLELIEPAHTNAEGNKKAYNLRSKLVHQWAQWFNSKLATDQEADDFFTFLNQELSKSTYCNDPPTLRYKSGGGYYSHIMTAKSFNTVEDKRTYLGRCTMPVLVLRGQCDNQKWGFANEYIELLPNARLEIINNSGHDLVGGNKERYIQRILNFLNMPLESL
jgi:proline iminopeptidase